jgi:hypothetical protein
MARTDSFTSLRSARYVGVSVCLTLLVLLLVSSNSAISSINKNRGLNFFNSILAPAEQSLRRRLLEQQNGEGRLETTTSSALSKLKLSLSGGNDSRTVRMLSTVEELADKTKDIIGDFVELGSLAPPAIISQTVWRASGQKRKIILIAGSTLWKNDETSQRGMFQNAGVMDSNILIVDDLLGAVRQHVDAIAMLFMNEYLLENIVFYELYDRVPMGGYVVIDQWRNDLFVNPIPDIVLVADGTVAYWKKTKANEELYLQNRASLTNERQTGLRTTGSRI